MHKKSKEKQQKELKYKKWRMIKYKISLKCMILLNGFQHGYIGNGILFITKRATFLQKQIKISLERHAHKSLFQIEENINIASG